MGNFESTLARMKELYNYGHVNESAKPSANETSSIECHRTAANGKEYGIIREASKYYIKVAPKEKATIAEAYDYIGGITEKKRFQYSSYGDALKNFEMKLGAINEGYNGAVSTETLDPYKKNLVLAEGTEKMKDEIARMRQIMHNASVVLNESTPNMVTVDTEAPAGEKHNPAFPFTETTAGTTKEKLETASDPKKQGTPFGSKKKLAKPESIKEEAELDADDEPINDDEDIEVDDEPEVDVDTEDELGAEDDDDMEFGTEDDEDSDDDEFDADELEDDEADEDEFEDEPEDDSEEDDSEFEVTSDDDDEFDSDELEDEPEDSGNEEEPVLNESRINRVCNNVVRRYLNEATLHDFGKHPSYRKQPFTTSPVGEDENEHGRDINHESVHSNAPYGEKIGSGFPFTNKVSVGSIVDSVVNEALYGRGLKKK